MEDAQNTRPIHADELGEDEIYKTALGGFAEERVTRNMFQRTNSQTKSIPISVFRKQTKLSRR